MLTDLDCNIGKLLLQTMINTNRTEDWKLEMDSLNRATHISDNCLFIRVTVYYNNFVFLVSVGFQL